MKNNVNIYTDGNYEIPSVLFKNGGNSVVLLNTTLSKGRLCVSDSQLQLFQRTSKCHWWGVRNTVSDRCVPPPVTIQLCLTLCWLEQIQMPRFKWDFVSMLTLAGNNNYTDYWALSLQWTPCSATGFMHDRAQPLSTENLCITWKRHVQTRQPLTSNNVKIVKIVLIMLQEL